MSQTTVSEFRETFVQGQVSNPSIADNDSKIVDGTSIQQGWAVIKGSNQDDVTVPAAAFTQTTIRGVAMQNPFQNEQALTTGINIYEDDQPIPVLKKGKIAVLLGGTVTEGGIAFFVHTTGGASTINTWRGDLDTDKASEVPARFDSDGVSGDIVLIRLDTGSALGSILT